MAIPEHHTTNFSTLLRACDNNDVCLMECIDKDTGKPVYTICVVNRVGEGYEMVPVAKMFEGNPYEQLIPPQVETTQ